MRQPGQRRTNSRYGPTRFRDCRLRLPQRPPVQNHIEQPLPMPAFRPSGPPREPAFLRRPCLRQRLRGRNQRTKLRRRGRERPAGSRTSDRAGQTQAVPKRNCLRYRFRTNLQTSIDPVPNCPRSNLRQPGSECREPHSHHYRLLCQILSNRQNDHP